MTKHFIRDLDRLSNQLLSLSGVVEEMIDKAAVALVTRNSEAADAVIASDAQVDEREVDLEDDCLKLLALHRPVAIDLRRVITVVKVNNDLERIADLAVNVAGRSLALQRHPAFAIPKSLEEMASIATSMVREAMNAFVKNDAAGARAVIARDDEIDKLNLELIAQLSITMKSDSDLVDPALHCFSASRHLERMGDHATNIAEDVVYLVEGEIVRHTDGGV